MKHLHLLLTLLLGLLLALPAQALSPEKALLTALADADQQAAEDQPFYRYLFLPDDTSESLTAFNPALRIHVNLISREATLAYPKGIIPGLWRADLREYGWPAEVFEKLAAIDPYFHRFEVREEATRKVVEVEEEYDQEYGTYDAYGAYTKAYVKREKRKVKKVVLEKRAVRKQFLYVPQGAGQLAALALLLRSDVPIVRADWFLVQGARQVSQLNEQTGAGYYDWLGIQTLDDYFRLGSFDPKIAARNETRFVIRRSGVTSQNRQGGRQVGGHWFTEEVAKQSGRGIAIDNLRRGEFQGIAQEHYLPLPNGGPATFLNSVDAAGKTVRQDSVPDNIAGNRAELNRSNDLRVHVNIACLQCHLGPVLQPLPDDVRAVYTGRLHTLEDDKAVQLELDRSYRPDLARLLQRDREQYQDFFTQTSGGKTPAEAVKIYSNAYLKYVWDLVTLRTAAAELGTDDIRFKKSLKEAANRLGRGDFRFDPFILDTAGTIPRLDWEDGFQDAQDAFYGILRTTPSKDIQIEDVQPYTPKKASKR